MIRVGRDIIGTVTLVLAGCLPVRPVLPESRPEPKHPFPEEQRTLDKTPAIQKTSFNAYPPPEFPQKSFDESQHPALAAIKPAVAQVAVPPSTPEPPRREPLADAVQCILENRHDEALRHLQAYDPTTQDCFLRLLPALSILTRKKMDDLSTAEVAVLQEQLSSLLAAIRPHSELALDKICYCEWIKSYGDYKPLPAEYAFAAPAESRPGECVQLYVEVRNFSSELRNGQHETRLSSAVEIRDGARVMWSHRFDDEKVPIRSRTQLHDYYSSYSFHVPRGIPPGTYTLEVQIADETNPNARRVARKAVEFRVAATPLRAAR